MGMFDYVRCHYNVGRGDLSGIEFQTKDTDAQYLHNYEVRSDGTLWHLNFDSDFVEDSTSFFGHRIDCKNHRWEQEKPTGEVLIHGDGYTIQFWFRDGVVKDFVVRKRVIDDQEQGR